MDVKTTYREQASNQPEMPVYGARGRAGAFSLVSSSFAQLGGHIRSSALLGLGAVAVLFGLNPAVSSAQQTSILFPNFHSYVPADPGVSASKPAEGVWKADMDLARDAWQRRDYKAARKHLVDALDKGDIVAAWYLGHLYNLGRGVKRDAKEAFRLYRKVALTYDGGARVDRHFMIAVDSLVRVADVYRDGSKKAAINKDWQRAYNLYNMASVHGHPGANYGLAVMFLKGIGVKRNHAQGIRYLNLAASRRYAPAEAMLGDMNWDDVNNPQHRVNGLMWYILALETANPAIHRQILNRHDVMMANASDEERALAQAMAARMSKQNPVRGGILQVSD